MKMHLEGVSLKEIEKINDFWEKKGYKTQLILPFATLEIWKNKP